MTKRVFIKRGFYEGFAFYRGGLYRESFYIAALQAEGVKKEEF